MSAWFKLRRQAAPRDRTVLLLPRTRGLSGVTSHHLPHLRAHPDSPWWFGSAAVDVGREAGPTGTASQCKSPAFCSWGGFPADARQGWGRRPAERESRVLRPRGGFCETGWNGRPRRRHICWAGGPGIWDIVFLAGSGGCQKPDKLITSDMGQSSFWRAQAGPPELLSGDGAAAMRKFIIQGDGPGGEQVLAGLGGGSCC